MRIFASTQSDKRHGWSNTRRIAARYSWDKPFDQYANFTMVKKHENYLTSIVDRENCWIHERASKLSASTSIMLVCTRRMTFSKLE